MNTSPINPITEIISSSTNQSASNGNSGANFSQALTDEEKKLSLIEQNNELILNLNFSSNQSLNKVSSYATTHQNTSKGQELGRQIDLLETQTMELRNESGYEGLIDIKTINGIKSITDQFSADSARFASISYSIPSSLSKFKKLDSADLQRVHTLLTDMTTSLDNINKLVGYPTDQNQFGDLANNIGLMSSDFANPELLLLKLQQSTTNTLLKGLSLNDDNSSSNDSLGFLGNTGGLLNSNPGAPNLEGLLQGDSQPLSLLQQNSNVVNPLTQLNTET